MIMKDFDWESFKGRTSTLPYFTSGEIAQKAIEIFEGRLIKLFTE